MELVLNQQEFINNKLTVAFGRGQTAVFTIVDEEFSGLNHLGRINRVTCLVTKDGAATLSGLVIGMGDGVVGVKSDDPSLRGKVLTHENMGSCVVELYE
jgi:hypothetical protein